MSERDPAAWWRHGVVYQVYLRSFADGNGDGTGDLAGLRTRLPYLRDLGVDAIWLNPWYPSPLRDGGYDVADYLDIDSRFGTLGDAESLIDDAHRHDLRVIADLVPNHTSSDHQWFQTALAARPGAPERDRYWFRDGTGPAGADPPTNWPSVFGGPAWTRVPDGQWYLHLFDRSQPDLNWSNTAVQDHFDQVLRFWLDRGIDGFRVDVAHGLVKDPALPDLPSVDSRLLATSPATDHPYWDRDDVHDIIRRWRRIVDSYGPDRMLVAEAWVRPERLPLYVRPGEYHQSFNFDLLEASWTASGFAATIAEGLKRAADVGAPSTWVLSNHDVMRHATRYGLPSDVDWRRWPVSGPHDLLDVGRGARRARAAALVLLSLPGAAYLYQGDELGLPEVWDLPGDVLDDPVWARSGHTRKGRDGCRVPLPWTADGPSFGFGSADPWLPQPADFGARSVAAQDPDPDSMINLYRRALRLRRRVFTLDAETPVDVEAADGLLTVSHADDVACWANMGPGPIDLPDAEIILASGPLDGDLLPPDAAVWLRVEPTG